MSFPDIKAVEQEIETAIAVQETSNGTAGVGASLNNPGAMRFSGWETYYGASESTNGKTATDAGFASFPTPQSGFDALLARIKQLVGVPGATITTLMETYAPTRNKAGIVINPTTPARIASIAQITGLDPTVPFVAQTSGTDATGGALAHVLLGGVNGGGGVTGAASANNTIVGRAAAGVAGCILLTIGLVAVSLYRGVTVVNSAVEHSGSVGKLVKQAAVAAT